MERIDAGFPAIAEAQLIIIMDAPKEPLN